jgi:hypothetical protein
MASSLPTPTARYAQQLKERTMPDQRQERNEQKPQLEETYQTHRVPIERALTPQEAQDFTWKRSYGEIQTYEHDRTHGRVHIDPQGHFYDRYAQPIAKEAALDHALGSQHHHAHVGTVSELNASMSRNKSEDHGQGISP